ncbi:MAG: hypothetical protein WCP16_09425 [Pseudanabaena sp. ELA645]
MAYWIYLIWHIGYTLFGILAITCVVKVGIFEVIALLLRLGGDRCFMLLVCWGDRQIHFNASAKSECA